MVYYTENEAETRAIGRRIAEKCAGGEVIWLMGEMGAGKTVLTKGIAEGLGITEPVLSPTFTIMNEYEGRLKLYHYDAYRLSDASEAEEAGLVEPLGAMDAVCVVEWPQNIADALTGRKAFRVTLAYAGEDRREITIDDE